MPTKPTEHRLLRFKREAWAGGNSSGSEPIWHLAAYSYERGGLYKSYTAMCGYEIKQAMFKAVLLTEAVKPKGATCKKCLKRFESGEPAIGRVGKVFEWVHFGVRG